MGPFLRNLNVMSLGRYPSFRTEATHCRLTPKSRSLQMEWLEQRCLLSVGPEISNHRCFASDMIDLTTQEVPFATSWPDSRVVLAKEVMILSDEMIPGWTIQRENSAPVFVKCPSLSGRESRPTLSSSRSQDSGTSFEIVLIKGPNLLANSVASTALDEAVAILESLFVDPITIVVDVELESISAGVLANTSAVTFEMPFDTIRDMMVADRDPADEDIVASLPACSAFSAVVPSGWDLTGNIEASRANLLALGTDPDSLSAGPNSQYDPTIKRDMAITFNSDFPWDFDRSNGITRNSYDFVPAAIHEMMHGLGFTSVVDKVDYNFFSGADTISPTPLDLFRLRPGDGTTDFTASPRILSPGSAVTDQVFYDGGLHDFTATGYSEMTVGDIPMATGQYNGDGQQAAHFKDNEDLHDYISVGLMDPILFDSGVQIEVQSPEIRALGLIGWDVAKPQQVIVYETNFTGGTPDDWTISDGSFDEKTWSDANPFPRPNPFSGTFMTVDSDWAGMVSMDESLTSGIIDCSAYENVTLHFTHYFASCTTEKADIDIRIDYGTWQNAVRYQNTDASGNVSLDISAIADHQANVEIRFRYWDAKWEYFWQVDNVRLTGDETNAPPTVSLKNVTTTLPEDTSIVFPIKVADILVTDDALGTNELSLKGLDAPLFELSGTELYLQAGLKLDFETNPQLVVVVNVDDATVGETPDDSATLIIAVTDVADPVAFADFGDAPTAAQTGFATSYPTTLALDGARHLPGGPQLGTRVDSESDGQPTLNADGDDASPVSGIDDEDGVMLTPQLTSGGLGIPLVVRASAPSFLNAWIDFNRSGTWETSEQIATDAELDTGISQLLIDVPSDAVSGTTYARLRLTSYHTGGTLAPTGLANDGEVEDYAWNIRQPTTASGRESLGNAVRRRIRGVNRVHMASINNPMSASVLTENARSASSRTTSSNKFGNHASDTDWQDTSLPHAPRTASLLSKDSREGLSESHQGQEDPTCLNEVALTDAAWDRWSEDEDIDGRIRIDTELIHDLIRTDAWT